MTTLDSGRFAITPAQAVEDHRLGDAAYRLLACLGTYSDRDGWCWPSMPTLASRLSITRQAVQRSIRQLAKLGYIEIEHRLRPNGASDKNRYRLLFDRALFQVRNHVDDDEEIAGEGGQPDVAGEGNVALRGRQRGRHTPRNVGDTPLNIEERTHKNVHGRSDDRRDTASQFEKFWQVYPSRGGHSNPKKPAREKFDAAVKRGADPADIIRGAENYAAFVLRKGTAGQFVKQAQYWLKDEGWEQYAAEAEPELPRAGLI